MFTLISVIAILLFLYGSVYISAAEAAFFSLSPMKVKTFAISRNPKQNLIASLLSKPRNLLVTIYTINTITNILLQNATSSAVGIEGGWMMKVLVPFIITLIFGEILPKNYGLQYNEYFSCRVVYTIAFLQKILRPIMKTTIAFIYPISRILFFYLKKEPSISIEELQHVLKVSEEQGILDPSESKLARGYLSIQQITVKEVMKRREEMITYDLKEPLSKLTHLFIEQQCSKIPVTDGSDQKIMGIITAKEFFLHRENLTSPIRLQSHLTKPFFIPESTSAKMLLKRFHEKNSVIAIVVDEYGTITGLITHEDLVEVVVGEISDLRDTKPRYTPAGPNEIIASGKLDLKDFNQIFLVNLMSKNNMVSIGGWLIEQLGDIPKSGTTYKKKGFLFQVLSADPNRIRRLYIRKLNKGKF